MGMVGAIVDRFAKEARRVAPKQTRNSYVLLPGHNQRLLRRKCRRPLLRFSRTHGCKMCLEGKVTTGDRLLTDMIPDADCACKGFEKEVICDIDFRW